MTKAEEKALALGLKKLEPKCVCLYQNEEDTKPIDHATLTDGRKWFYRHTENKFARILLCVPPRRTKIVVYTRTSKSGSRYVFKAEFNRDRFLDLTGLQELRESVFGPNPPEEAT